MSVQGCRPKSSYKPQTQMQACPANSGSSSGSDTCTCLAGFYGPAGGPCIQCPAGSYCASGQLSACPAFTSSAAQSVLSTDCKCMPGYVGPDGGMCDACWIDFYCPGGMSSRACPEMSSSPQGSSSDAACICDAGYTPNFFFIILLGTTSQFCEVVVLKSRNVHLSVQDFCNEIRISGRYLGDAGGPCTACPEGVYCESGVAINCPDFAAAAAGSTSVSDCKCKPGYYAPEPRNPQPTPFLNSKLEPNL